jgi:hypothetical protein
VWGWANGYVQYRDLFDNHTPLFHMLCAPLAALLGDRPDLLVLMRLAMLPVAALTLLAVWSTGKSLFSKRVGLWSAVLVALLPFFVRLSVQFRTDQLWAACWLVAIAVLVRPPLTRLRGFFFGLMLGMAASVSLKTSFLSVGLLAALAATFLFSIGLIPWRERVRHLLGVGAAAAWGIVTVPSALILFFAVEKALPQFYYGAIGHNVMPGIYHLHPLSLPLCAAAVVLGIVAALVARRSTAAPGLAVRRVFVCLLAGALFAVLLLWPVLTRQDLLPIYPLLIVALVAAAGGLLRRLGMRLKSRTPYLSLYPLAVLLAITETAFVAASMPYHDTNVRLKGRWVEVLRLTDPGELVMDRKGELIFRPRAYTWVLETVTLLRFKNGLLRDDVASQMIDKRVCVAAMDYIAGLPDASAFLKRNYVCVGKLWVAGKFLRADEADPMRPVQFELKIPARYTIITPAGAGRGLLDGAEIRGSRLLDAGVHEYACAANETRPVVVWAQAVERGFSPFVVSRSEPNP